MQFIHTYSKNDCVCKYKIVYQIARSELMHIKYITQIDEMEKKKTRMLSLYYLQLINVYCNQNIGYETASPQKSLYFMNSLNKR